MRIKTKKRLASAFLVLGIVGIADVASYAGNRTVSINASNTIAESSTATISKGTRISYQGRNNDNYNQRGLWIELYESIPWAPDRNLAGKVISAGTSIYPVNYTTDYAANIYIRLDPVGAGAAGCVGSGRMDW